MPADKNYRRRIAFWQLSAYLLIFGMFLFVVVGQRADDSQICESAQENRDATRHLVNAIYTLGQQLIEGSANDSEPTPEQTATLQRFQDFRDAELAQLEEPVCSNGHVLNPIHD